MVDETAERLMTRASFGPPRTLPNPKQKACLLPRSAAFAGNSLYVTCLGIDALVELDARAVDPLRAETRRFHVASGPTGVAIDAAGHRAVVWSQFDRELSIVSLAETKPIARVAVARSAAGIPSNVALGRRLFHQASEAKISQDGRACASCHPDGREDALTWSTPDGPRQTPMLAGRAADSAPYGWMGNSAAIDEHLKKTLERLGGEGLSADEVAALVDYVVSMSPPRARAVPLDEARQKLVERGRALFHAKETACSTCHDEGHAFADGIRHLVTYERPSARSQGFDTPSLRFVGGTAPYFHDGRYPTLTDLLVAPDHAMGEECSPLARRPGSARLVLGDAMNRRTIRAPGAFVALLLSLTSGLQEARADDEPQFEVQTAMIDLDGLPSGTVPAVPAEADKPATVLRSSATPDIVITKMKTISKPPRKRKLVKKPIGPKKRGGPDDRKSIWSTWRLAFRRSTPCTSMGPTTNNWTASDRPTLLAATTR